jgi:ABC-2 type transport system ATP-binding protein
MIEVKDLTKSYGTVEALRGISFKIEAGEIVGLLGPNGAGKTTVMKILTGYLQPDEGSVTIDNLDVLTHTQEVQAGIGYQPENAPLYPELSVQSYLNLMAELRQIPQDEQLARISDAVLAVDIKEYLTRPVSQLSKGYRQRLGLAQAILHKPRLLILDEPTIGLDPTQIIEIRKLIKRLARHSTVLFSTHILPEVEALCDRAIILMNGEIKADARLSELASSTSVILVLNHVDSEMEPALGSLEGLHSLEAFQTANGYPAFRIAGEDQTEISAKVFQLASTNNWPLRELKYETRTLETVFNELAVAA